MIQHLKEINIIDHYWVFYEITSAMLMEVAALIENDFSYLK